MRVRKFESDKWVECSSSCSVCGVWGYSVIIAKSPDLKPLDYRIWSNLQERLSQPDSWRWPAEVAPDQGWEYFQHLFINEAVRQWRPRLRACIRAHGGHSEDRLLVRWQSHVCLVAYSGHLCFEWSHLTGYNYCGHWPILLKFGNLFATRRCYCCYKILLKSDIVCLSYENVYSGLLFSGHSVYGAFDWSVYLSLCV